MNSEAKRTRARLDQLDRQQQYYFFERITNPKAFDVLAEAGAFASVTPPEVVEGKVLHYAWPPTFYLRNVVIDIPDRIAELIRGIDTENQRVMYDLAELVAKMPAALQSTLVKQLCAWLDRPQIEWIWATYVNISRSLAFAGDIPAATMIAKRVLQLSLVERESLPALQWRSLDAVAAMGDINYDHALERLIGAFRDRHVDAIVSTMRDLLSEALKLENGPESPSHDHSSIWARSLENHPIGSGAKEALAYRLFDTLRAATRDGSLGLVDAVKLIAECRWPVFRRMRLALVTDFGSPTDMAKEMHVPKFMSSHELDRERNALLTKVYPALSFTDKAWVWQSIRSSLVSKKRLRDHFRGSVPADELEARVDAARRAHWLERLRPIGSFLEGERLDRFQALREEFPPSADARPDDGAVWVAPQAPDSLEVLEQLSTADLLTYVEDWRAPVGTMFAPSPEGLARTIAPIVERRRVEVLHEVERMLHWPPVYVWHVIDALRKHVSDPEFDLDAFVRLMSYVHLQSDAYRAGAYSAWEESPDDGERAWPTLGTITAFAVADVIRAAPCDRSLRDRVWAILLALLGDEDPTPEDDARHANTASWNYALNTVRGAAMLSVFDYARWIYRAHGGDAARPDLIALAPELFKVLDERLDPVREPSPAVRAAYGQNFVSIYAMARPWTISAIPSILGGTALLSAVGWRTYLAMNAVYDETFEHLKDYYLLAVQALEVAPDHQDADVADFEQGLPAHIMRVYARGLTRLDDPTSLIRQFLRVATAKMVGELVQSAGSGAGGPDLALEIWDRLRALYDFILESRAAGTLGDRRAALETFGLWVIAPSIDRAWAIDALSRTLRLTGGQIAIRHRVLEWLAALSEVDPYGAISVLRNMLDEGAYVRFAIDDSFRIIISRAVSAGGSAYRVATQVDEHLTAIGVHQFHDLFRRGGS